MINGVTLTCLCPNGYEISTSNSSQCVDKNECTTEGSSLCPSKNYVKCVNTVGSYECQCINNYYKKVEAARCIDKDECSDGSGTCKDSKATCLNQVGKAHKCVCPTPIYQESVDASKCTIAILF